MQNLLLKTEDGIKIAVNYYNQGFDEVVIIAPGWCMTKDSWAFKKIAEDFSRNFDVLSFDFRGHGKSGGFYTFTSKEENDLNAVVEFAALKYQKIYVAGFSLGAATALIFGAKNLKADKIIAVSPPSDFNKIENKMWKKEAWGETFKKFELNRFLSIRPNIIPLKKERPIDFVDKIKCPTLFIAGKLDPTVCFWHTQKLYEKAECKKAFKLFEEGIHAEDIFLKYNKECEKICLEFLKN